MGRDVPDAIARQLRQEAGFGCCKCGYPVFQYHHIVPYNEDEHFRPEDMMVLCPNCHGMATRGALPRSEQRELKLNPFSVSRGYTNGLLTVTQTNPQIAIRNHAVITSETDPTWDETAVLGPAILVGGVATIGLGPILVVDDEVLLSLTSEGGRLEISAKLYDSEGNLLVEIDRNEWKSNDSLPWDLDFRHNILTIRNRPRNIALDIDASKAEQSLLSIKGTFWAKGLCIRLTRQGVMIDGVMSFRIVGVVLHDIAFVVNTSENGGIALADRDSLALI